MHFISVKDIFIFQSIIEPFKACKALVEHALMVSSGQHIPHRDATCDNVNADDNHEMETTVDSKNKS